jgi:hypothetical protein
MDQQQRIAQNLSEFLPVEVINIRSLAPEQLVGIWHRWDALDVELFAVGEELEQLGIWVSTYRQADYLPDGTFILTVKRRIEALKMIGAIWKEIVGGSTRAKVRAFLINGALARTRSMLMAVGVGNRDACILSAVIAIRVGHVLTEEMTLSADRGDVSFDQLQTDDRLAERIEKRCRRYAAKIEALNRDCDPLLVFLLRSVETNVADLLTEATNGFLDVECAALGIERKTVGTKG